MPKIIRQCDLPEDAPIIKPSIGGMLKHQMSDEGMTVRLLAFRMRRPVEYVQQLLDGERTLSGQDANALERIFYAQAKFWMMHDHLFRHDQLKFAARYNIDIYGHLAVPPRAVKGRGICAACGQIRGIEETVRGGGGSD